ncbi:hypothetical protein [Pseudoalteromonas sp. NC201]|uniref:hypothetical protein n=1 Tax=Pseudoalteromonas sp. NC201 TaxID=1514074 RepID=UPI000C7AC8A1|nr:hypothetical protein [Pseudoalteromonas sp. NC201]AUJ68752.1 hypothetical protein PNC201_02065 [Pseudoalteromonas sp. NC201]
MENTAVKIPIPIKMLCLFKSSLISANSLCLSIIALHLVISFLCNDFTILSAGGGLLCAISLILFLSYNVPTTEEDYLKYLKTMYPLNHEQGVLGERVTEERRIELENPRIVKGNLLLSVQSYYLVWSVIGTLIWSYAGYL